MTRWHSVDDVLNYAIGEEQAAAEFYTQLASQAKMPGMRQVLRFCPRRDEPQSQARGHQGGG